MTAITGAFKDYSVATTTAATTATAYMFKQGYAFGTVTNPSSGARAITYYGVTRTSTGDSGPWPVKDADGVAVTQSLAAEEMWELHPACAGVPILMAVTVAAASTKNLLFHFER